MSRAECRTPHCVICTHATTILSSSGAPLAGFIQKFKKNHVERKQARRERKGGKKKHLKNKKCRKFLIRVQLTWPVRIEINYIIYMIFMYTPCGVEAILLEVQFEKQN